MHGRLLVLFLFMANAVLAVTLSTCTVINSPGYYELSGDLSGSTCIDIESSDVILDCKGYQVYGSSEAVLVGEQYFQGFAPAPFTNITIKNCDFRGDYGVKVLGGDVEITDSNFRTLASAGVHFEFEDGTLILRNNVFDYATVYFSGQSGLIENNNFKTMGYGDTSIYAYGLSLSSSPSVEIRNNNFEMVAESGSAIYVAGMPNSLIDGNTVQRIDRDGVGIFVSSQSSQTTIQNNDIAGGSSLGDDWGIVVKDDEIYVLNNNIENVEFGLQVIGDSITVNGNRIGAVYPIVWGDGDAYGNYETVTNSQFFNNYLDAASYGGEKHYYKLYPQIPDGSGNSFDYGGILCSIPSVINGCVGGNYYAVSHPDIAPLISLLHDTDGDKIADSPNIAVPWPGGADNYPLTDKTRGKVVGCVEINGSGYYELDSDISGFSTSSLGCLTLSGDNIILDCKNNKITNTATDPSHSAILIYAASTPYKNITIKNCKLQGPQGLEVYRAQDLYLNNVESTATSKYAIKIDSSSDIYLNDVSMQPASSSPTCLLFAGSSGFYARKVSCTSSATNLAFEDSDEIYVNESTLFGVYLYNSNVGVIAKNTLKGATGQDSFALYLDGSNEFEIKDNNISNADYGIILNGQDNQITNNLIENVGKGIALGVGAGTPSQSNTIYNNKISATTPVYVDNAGTNSWYAVKDCTQTNIVGGNCLGGNYYSDYSGSDADGDGLGDTPYTIDSNNVDVYPLLLSSGSAPSSSYSITYTYNCPNLEITVLKGGTPQPNVRVHLREISSGTIRGPFITNSQGKVSIDLSSQSLSTSGTLNIKVENPSGTSPIFVVDQNISLSCGGGTSSYSITYNYNCPNLEITVLESGSPKANVRVHLRELSTGTIKGPFITNNQGKIALDLSSQSLPTTASYNIKVENPSGGSPIFVVDQNISLNCGGGTPPSYSLSYVYNCPVLDITVLESGTPKANARIHLKEESSGTIRGPFITNTQGTASINLSALSLSSSGVFNVKVENPSGTSPIFVVDQNLSLNCGGTAPPPANYTYTLTYAYSCPTLEATLLVNNAPRKDMRIFFFDRISSTTYGPFLTDSAGKVAFNISNTTSVSILAEKINASGFPFVVKNASISCQQPPSPGALYINYSFRCPEYLTVYAYENNAPKKDIYIEVNDSYFGGLITSGLTDAQGKIDFNIIPPIDLTIKGTDQLNNKTSNTLTISLPTCQPPTASLLHSFNCPDRLQVVVVKGAAPDSGANIRVVDRQSGAILSSATTSANGVASFTISAPRSIRIEGTDSSGNALSPVNADLSCGSIAPSNATAPSNGTAPSNATSGSTPPANVSTPSQPPNQTSQPSSQPSTATQPSTVQPPSYSKVGGGGGKATYKISRDGTPLANAKVKVIYKDGTSEILQTNENGEIVVPEGKEIASIEEVREELPWLWIVAALLVLGGVLYYWKYYRRH